MSTNRSAIAALQTQRAVARPTSVAQLNDLIAEPVGPGLVRGPILPPGDLPISPDEPLIVISGREVVVAVGDRLRELLPPDSYDRVSWSRQIGVELYVVETRVRTLLISTQHEINLRYPLTAGSDYLQPFDLEVALEYRVLDVQRVALDAVDPLLRLYDAALHTLRALLDNSPVEQCLDLVRQLPARLRSDCDLGRIGFEVQAAYVTGRPAPANLHPIVTAHTSEERALDRLRREMATLSDNDIPCYVHETGSGYLLHIPLFDGHGRQMSIHVICPFDYPRVAPQLFVELDGIEQPNYVPRLLHQWAPEHTLLDLVTAVIDDF